MRRQRMSRRFKPYTKRKGKKALTKAQASAVAKIAKRVEFKHQETKYFAKTWVNGSYLINGGSTGCDNYNLFNDIPFGTGIQAMTGRSIETVGIKVSLVMSNFVRTAVGTDYVSKNPMFFNIALIESSKHGTGPSDFTLNGATGDSNLGREGAINTFMTRNFSKEKCKIKFIRKIIVAPLNTDHNNTAYSSDQSLNTVARDFWIPYKRKIHYENNGSANQQIQGDQVYLIAYAGTQTYAGFLSTGLWVINTTVYFKDS